MKKIFLVLTLLAVLISCSKTLEKNSEIRDNIYSELIKYQNENPIPSKSKQKEINSNDSLFIYEVLILPKNYTNPLDENDAVYIKLSNVGAKNSEKKFGVYENSELKPTYIIDEAGLIENVVKTKEQKNFNKYYPKKIPKNNVNFPVKMFTIKNGELKLIGKIK